MCINFNSIDVDTQSRLRATYANAKMPIEIKREANASTKPHKEEKPMQENRQETSRKKTWYKSSQRRPTKLIFRQFVRLWIVSKGNGKTRSWENGDKGQMLLLPLCCCPKRKMPSFLSSSLSSPRAPKIREKKRNVSWQGGSWKKAHWLQHFDTWQLPTKRRAAY